MGWETCVGALARRWSVLGHGSNPKCFWGGFWKEWIFKNKNTRYFSFSPIYSQKPRGSDNISGVCFSIEVVVFKGRRLVGVEVAWMNKIRSTRCHFYIIHCVSSVLKNNSQKAAKCTNNTWNSFIQIFVFDKVFVVAGMMKARASAKFLKGLMQSLEIKKPQTEKFWY